MEDGHFRPKEEDNESQHAAPKKKRSGDFLSQYLLRRHESKRGNSEKDKDEESEEKPKKWLRLFRGIFKQLVQQPESAKKTPEHNFDRSAWFAWELTDSDPKESVSSTTDTRTYTSENSHDSMKEQFTYEGQAVKHTRTQPGTNAPNSTERATQEISDVPMTGDKQYYSETQDRKSQIDEHEVIVERGAGTASALSLVGAEYFARKRAERKIERKTTGEISSIRKELKNSETANEELNAIVMQNREQLEKLKRERGTQEQGRPISPVETRSSEQPIQQSSYERKSDPEQSVEQPRVIFERIANAAERDAPVERVYERSHEIKDDKSIPAVSIGAIMASQAASAKIPLQTSQAAQMAISNPPHIMPIKELIKDESNQQAIKNGFTAAISIIIFGVLAYLMIK